MVKCPNCPREFADRNAVFNHINHKHGGKGRAAFRHEYEMSDAELVIELANERQTHRAGGN